MGDELKKNIPKNGSKISLSEPHEVEYWCGYLECVKEDLIGAVTEVGHSAVVVKAYLNTKIG